jgi:hypothetical protein
MKLYSLKVARFPGVASFPLPDYVLPSADKIATKNSYRFMGVNGHFKQEYLK